MRLLRFFGIMLIYLISGMLMFAIFLVLVVTMILRGPSAEARDVFVHSCEETSAMKFVPRLFLDEGLVDDILNPEIRPDTFTLLPEEPARTADAGADAVLTPDAVTDDSDDEEWDHGVRVEDVIGDTYRGKMMLVKDPHRVIVGTLKNYGEGMGGKYLPDFVSAYNAVGGTNAGGFDDPDGHGAGGCPLGIVIENGAIRYGDGGTMYKNVMGFDSDGIMHVGDMTGSQALEAGIVTGVSFPIGSILVQDGVGCDINVGGINPRTALGQRADGTVLMLVVEGRHAGSLGASHTDLRDIMLSYGAVTASMLDGGTSSTMIYKGEQITRGSNIIGMRAIPDAILVLPEDEG